MIRPTDIQHRARDLYALRYEPEGVRTLAQVLWCVLLVCAATLALAALAWGIWDLFDVFGTLSQTSNAPSTPPSALNRSALQALVQTYQDRQTQYGAFEQNPPPSIPDPSR